MLIITKVTIAVCSSPYLSIEVNHSSSPSLNSLITRELGDLEQTGQYNPEVLFLPHCIMHSLSILLVFLARSLCSDRSLSRTHCEKFGFLAARSQEVGSRVMSFCLILPRNCSFHIYMSQESPRGIPRRLEIWLVCHGGGGDKELGGGHFLQGLGAASPRRL